MNKIVKVRNKIYAHTDIHRDVDFPTLEEMKKIIELASYSYNNLHGFINGSNMDFSRGLNNLTMRDVIRIMKKGLNYKSQ